MPRPRKPANPFRHFLSSSEVILHVVLMYRVCGALAQAGSVAGVATSAMNPAPSIGPIWSIR